MKAVENNLKNMKMIQLATPSLASPTNQIKDGALLLWVHHVFDIQARALVEQGHHLFEPGLSVAGHAG